MARAYSRSRSAAQRELNTFKIFPELAEGKYRWLTQGEKLRARYPQSDCCTKCRMRIYDIYFRNARNPLFLIMGTHRSGQDPRWKKSTESTLGMLKEQTPVGRDMAIAWAPKPILDTSVRNPPNFEYKYTIIVHPMQVVHRKRNEFCVGSKFVSTGRLWETGEN